MGLISLNLFGEDVDSLDHPDVQEYYGILKEMAEAYGCNLKGFAIKRGVVLFGFDNDEILYDIMEDIKNSTGVEGKIVGSIDEFVSKTKDVIENNS